MTHFETSMKDRLAVKAAELRRNRALWQIAETLCIDLGITSIHITLVPYIGNGQEKSNLEAIKNWLDSEYEDLVTEFDPLNARKVSDILALNLARNMPSHILGE